MGSPWFLVIVERRSAWRASPALQDRGPPPLNVRDLRTESTPPSPIRGIIAVERRHRAAMLR
jgi:hypothetical protein